jgi:hypothetical protein
MNFIVILDASDYSVMIIAILWVVCNKYSQTVVA